MKREIERRFLVNSDKLPPLSRGKLVSQGYLSKLEKKDSPIVRVRIEGKKSYLTIKIFESELSKLEYEYKLPLREAEKLLESSFANVQKIRYNLKVYGHSWVVECYEGENFPLIVAEIELTEENETFQKPLWISKEVSYDPRFHAYNLALKPFSSWKNH